MANAPLQNEKAVERHLNDTQAVDEPQSSNEVDADDPERSPRSLHGVKWLITTTAILSTTLLFSLDATIVANVQPSIIKEFGEVTKLSWLGTAFALGSASTILSWSKAYRVLNVKWLYISHVVVFEVGSALCGGAPNMNALIVGRAIAGVGASGMYVGCLTYVSVLTTVQERPIYMGLVGLVWGIGTILGPVIGGAFIESDATWRWAFYINLVVGALFPPVYFWLLPSIHLQKNIPLRQRLLRHIDWLGNLFFIGSISCLILAITFGGSVFSWSSASEIALWITAGVLSLVFGLTQTHNPLVDVEYKLYPTTFLRRPVMVMLQIAIFMSSVSLLLPVFYIPLYYQFTQGSSALGSAVHLLPFVVTVVMFSLVNGSLMAKLGYYMPWYLFGGALVLAGSALMYTVTATTSNSAVYGYTVLIGTGLGSFLQAGYGVTQVLVKSEEITDAVGFMSLGQNMGVAVSLAIAGAIFQNRAVSNVVSVLPSIDISSLHSAITGIDSTYFASLSPAEREGVVDGIVKALSDVYIIVMIAGATVLLLAIFLPKTKLFTRD